MSDLLRELRMTALSGMVLPSNRFFKPTPTFFEALGEHEVHYVDAGCGTGETTTEAVKAGLRMIGVDIAHRDGEEPGILHTDAVYMPYSQHMWPAICRPSHDGWAEELADRALANGAHVFYAGFPKNYDRDLGRLKKCILQRWKVAGEEGETLVLLDPDKYTPPRRRRN